MENLFRARINTGFFRFLIKRNTRLMILTSVAMIALYPLLAFTEFVFNGTYSQGFFNVGRTFQLIVFFVSLVIVPFVIFSYLNSKKSLDVYHALPITRKDLFLTGLIASVVVVLIPFLSVYAIGWIYNAMVVPTIDNTLIFENLYYSLALSMAIALPFMFSMMNTGTSVDGFLYGLIIHFIPMIAYGTYLVFGNTVLLGFRAPTENTFLLFTAPLWTIFELNLNRNLLFPNPDLVALYWFVMSFGMAWLVLYFYKIRRSEKAENPFTNNKFYPIIVSLFILMIQFFFYSTFTLLTEGSSLDLRTLIFPVFFTFVAYMILDVIANRGFKNFTKALVKFAIITAVSLTTFLAATFTGGAGYVNNVPNPNRIAKVEFLINDESGLFSPSYSSYIYNSSNGVIAYEDEADIQVIVDFHQSIIDRFKELGISTNNYNFDENSNIESSYPFELSPWTTSEVQLRYTLNNGSTVLRSYRVPFLWTDTILPLSVSEPNLFNRYPHLSHRDRVTSIRFAPTTLHREYFVASDKLDALFTTYVEEYIQFGSSILEGEPVVGYIITGATQEDIYAYGGTSIQALPVFESFTKTIALLDLPEIVIPQSLTFELILPSTRENPVEFYIQNFDSSLRYWEQDPSKEFATYTLSADEMTLLVPYMTAHHVNDDLVGLIKVVPEFGFGVERYNNFVFYSLLEEGRSILDGIIAEKTPVFKNIEAIYLN
jgi:ABC-2 type transport system permease protein